MAPACAEGVRSSVTLRRSDAPRGWLTSAQAFGRDTGSSTSLGSSESSVLLHPKSFPRGRMAASIGAGTLEDGGPRRNKRARAFAFGDAEPDAAERALSYQRGALDDVTNKARSPLRDRLGVLAAGGDRVELQQRGSLSLHALRWAWHV